MGFGSSTCVISYYKRIFNEIACVKIAVIHFIRIAVISRVRSIADDTEANVRQLIIFGFLFIRD